MPCLRILTNLPKSKIPNNFVNNIIPLLAKVLDKPEFKFLCVVAPDCLISFRGESNKPGGVATLESIGHLGVEENKVIAKEVTEYVERELGIPRENFFISFYDKKGQDLAKGGETMA